MIVMDKIREGIRNFLDIKEADNQTISIMELLSLEGNIAKNKIWYRGDSYELDQFYKKISSGSDGQKFWGAVQTRGQAMRKIHTGIPSIMVDRLTDIVINDFNRIDFRNESDGALWKEIAENSEFNEVLKKAITDALVLGDGAFKISHDSNVSQYPIIEFYGADRVLYKLNRGQVREVVFKTEYEENNKKYYLHETYGYGYIAYNLYYDDREVPLNTLKILAGLQPLTFDNSVILAHRFKFSNSLKWEGRGQSIFDKKSDAFDSLDEAWSQWMDALRAGRTKEYIPESLLPRDPETGGLISPNNFDNRYLMSDDTMSEGAQNEIKVVQPGIPHDSYLATYITALDLCLQGIISPSTLGIDVKKLDNAEAQREKEKTTLYTRGNIVYTVQKQLPLFIDKVFKSMQIRDQKPLKDVECTVNFGEYANPSFESQVETISKGKQGGIMSIEASVEELYGDTKDDEWKKEEVARLKIEQGIADMEEPAVNLEGVELDEGNGNEPGLSDVKEPSAKTIAGR